MGTEMETEKQQKRYFSPEHRASLSRALKGKPLSPEHCAAISKGLTGRTRVFSERHKQALSEAMKEVWARRRERLAQAKASVSSNLSGEVK